MNNVRLLLKYIAPYKWSAVKNILYNILSALFTVVTFSLIKPFLTVLFDFKNLYFQILSGGMDPPEHCFLQSLSYWLQVSLRMLLFFSPITVWRLSDQVLSEIFGKDYTARFSDCLCRTLLTQGKEMY